MIKIYSTPTCFYCRKAKEFFAKNGIQYEEVNVISSKEVTEQFIKSTGQRGVPVIELNGEIIVGFDEEVLRKKLALSTNG